MLGTAGRDSQTNANQLHVNRFGYIVIGTGFENFFEIPWLYQRCYYHNNAERTAWRLANLPAKIYANEGVAQMLFLESDEECETSYKDRGGKYQGQRGVTLPRT